VTYPDVEGALRTWLRANATVNALVGQRVFFGVPKQATEQSFPLLTIARVGGGGDPSDASVDAATIQIDCWGTIDKVSGYGKKSVATELAAAVREALESLTNGGALTASVQSLGAEVVSSLWAPDPDDDRPRYSLTANVWTISL
jgi:hypothetical protein